MDKSSLTNCLIVPSAIRNGTFWEFLLILLVKREYKEIIEWQGLDSTFRFLDAPKVAILWGLTKHNTKMDETKMKRVLRQYSGENLVLRISMNVYKFQFDIQERTGLSIVEIIDRKYSDRNSIELESEIRSAMSRFKNDNAITMRRELWLSKRKCELMKTSDKLKQMREAYNSLKRSYDFAKTRYYAMTGQSESDSDIE